MPPRPVGPGCGSFVLLIVVFTAMMRSGNPVMIAVFLVLLAVYVYRVRGFRTRMRVWLKLRDEYIRMHHQAAATAHAQAAADAYRRAQYASGQARYSTSSQGYTGARQGRSVPPARPTPSQPDPYEVLQVPRGADSETIRTAYRNLASQYHPDRVANLGPEFRDLAEEKMKQINAAYSRLRSR